MRTEMEIRREGREGGDVKGGEVKGREVKEGKLPTLI